MMKLIRILFLIAVTSAGIFAQTSGTIRGSVRFEGKPAENATVWLLKNKSFTTGIEARTDADGNFTLRDIPPGAYQVIAFVSFDSARQGRTSQRYAEAMTEVTVDTGEVGGIALELVETDLASSVRLREHVEISADESQPIDEVSKSVDVIPAQQMRDRADFTLIDTLRTIPGFRIQQLGGFGRTASIKSRGLRNQDTAVLIDGIRFRDPGSITGDATPFLSDFTLTSVNRIEVLRGSGSSLYGTNAIGGTIDFQTPRPDEVAGLHGQVSGALGGLGLGRFRGNVSYGAPDHRFGIGAAISRTAYTKGIDGDDNASNTNFQSRLEFNPTAKTNLSGRFFVSDSRVRLNVSPDTLGTLPPASTIIDAREGVNFVPDADDPDSIQKGRFFSGQFAASHDVNKRIVLSGSYQGLVTKRENEDGVLGPGFQSAFTSNVGGDIHTANARTTITPDRYNTITAGYEFEVEHFRNSGLSGTDVFSTGASQRSHTLFVQDLVGLLDGRLQFSGGARAQWFSLGTPVFSASSPYEDFALTDPPAAYTFDGSASYFIPRTGTKLRTHVGSGYRVPSLYERFGTFFFFGSFFAQGNPGLKPERSTGIDAGIDQYFAGKKVKASATWFYTRIKDEITYLPTDDFSAPVYYNFDRHYSRGAEFSIDARPTRSTDIFASYTFTNSDVRNFRRAMIVLATSTDRAAFAIPGHQFTLVATQRFKRFWISLDVLATSSYLAPVFSSSTFGQYTYRFEGNRRADVTGGYTFKLPADRYSLRLYGTVENVFDNEYFENGFRTPGRSGRVGLAFGF